MIEDVVIVIVRTVVAMVTAVSVVDLDLHATHQILRHVTQAILLISIFVTQKMDTEKHLEP